ncbi:MAG: extracellular solute-binding protein [Treponema sp.]|jgi:putative aldouronate transport system substrate-binding protein|nr:extracellular solute-binding protein [Treponema sp.]
MKKTIAAALLLCLTTLAFAGGRQSGGTAPSDDPNYPIEISVFTQAQRQQPPANNKFYRLLKEKFNVTLKWDILVGDRNQKRGIMIASGDYPDIIEVNETAFIDAGALIPLEDLIEKEAPNVARHYKDGGAWDKTRWSDGHIYYMTNYGVVHGQYWQPIYNDSALWVQKEVLKDAGYPKITTMDEYFDLLINYAKKYPTIDGAATIPFTILTYDWHAFALWNPPNFLAGYPNEGNGTVDPVTHKYENFFTQDISKRWFKKLNELNAQGYIDRSAFVDNYDQYLAKLSAGRVLGMHDQYWQFSQADYALRDTGRYNRSFVGLPIVYDHNITPRYRNLPIPNLGRGGGISVKAKDPARIMRFINGYMDEEFQRTAAWGIEGQDWQYDAGRKPYRTPEQRANWENDAWQVANTNLLMRDVFPKLEGSFSDGIPTDLTWYPPEREALLRPEDKELFAAYGVNSSNEIMDKNPAPNTLWFPTWSMPNPPDGSAAQMAYAKAELTMKKYLPTVITCPPAQFESLWTEYVNQMRADGIGQYEAYMQEQLDQRIKDWSGGR